MLRVSDQYHERVCMVTRAYGAEAWDLLLEWNGGTSGRDTTQSVLLYS